MTPVHTETAAAPIPALEFLIEGCAPLVPAAVPTLEFGLRIDASRPVRSAVLDVQIQIAPRQRRYAQGETELLLELFGSSERWAGTLRTLPWTRTTLVVPPFSEAATVPLRVTCTYDLEVAAARYFAALADGEIPLEFLFAGSVFYASPTGALQTARISWNSEATYRLPVAVWREMMDRHFPAGAWLRLDRESFESLCAYKARHSLQSWEATIESLLRERAE